MSRAELLRKFENLPSLDGAVFNSNNKAHFSFPQITHPDTGAVESREDITWAYTKELSYKQLPKEKLQNAIRKATNKLKFLDTSLEQWESDMIFTEDQLLDKKNYTIKRSTKSTWVEGTAVNTSRLVANDWFENSFLKRVSNKGLYSHSQALIGNAGSGKSTLLKYLISQNYSLIQSKRIVISRFEFLKFMSQRKKGVENEQSIADYVSFIHSRDLILNHFYDLTNCNKLTFKEKYVNLEFRNKEIKRITSLAPSSAELLSIHNSDLLSDQIRNVLTSGLAGNRALMDALNEVEYDVKLSIINILSPGKTILTIFDGLDSIDTQDAFENTKNWELVCKIIDQRHRYSTHQRLHDLSINIQTDSLVITRKNTFEMLVKDVNVPEGMNNLSFQKIYSIENINGVSAIAGVIKRVKRLLVNLEDPEISENEDEHERAMFVVNMMDFIEKTMDSISRWQNSDHDIDQMYGFFDGNLRDLFKFILQIFHWSIKQMENKNFLEPEDYGTSVWRLTSALSSVNGERFFRWKSYRIIELLLVSDRGWFENMVFIPVSKSPYARVKSKIKSNKDFAGRIDNIYNYLEPFQGCEIDNHSIFEKLRILQILNVKDRTAEEIEKKLVDLFGYQPKDTHKTLLYLIKTNFVSANVVSLANRDIDVRYRATNRAKLCLSSLIFNLSYLEHIFHKTLFPTGMVQGINDKPRNENLPLWITNSIRNAYVMLSYMKMVEDNPCNGKVVSDEYRVVEKIRLSVYDSLSRMTEGVDEDEDDNSDYKGIDFSEICDTALRKIRGSENKWKNMNLI